MQQKMLNVGCGSFFDTRWTNIDIYSSSPSVIQHDITKGLPFPAASFDVVYHSHILEHLDKASGVFLLRECYRVLKPNGILRVVVPDLQFSCQLYLQSLDQALTDDTPLTHEHYEWSLLNLFDQMVRTRSGGEIATFMARPELLDIEFVVENGGGTVIKELRAPASAGEKPLTRLFRIFRSGDFVQLYRKALLRLALGKASQQVNFRQMGEIHQWMYDQYSMRHLLSDLGFGTVRFLTADQSSIADWLSYGLDVRPDGSVHKPHSLFTEALKSS
jgi:predicted SAM-dependent methyltransferase